MTRLRFVLLGAKSGPRIDAFEAALHKLGYKAASKVSYAEFIEDPSRLERALDETAVLRFDSPDRDIRSLRALALAGAENAEKAGLQVLCGRQLDSVLASKGAIGSPAQTYFGLCLQLSRASRLAWQANARLCSAPNDIALAFDKIEAAVRLAAHRVPVPRQIGEIKSFADLLHCTMQASLPRVFVKLRYGSSAAGMMAFAGRGGDWVAYTTAVLDGETLHASRSVRRMTKTTEIAKLVDKLAPLGLLAEAWQPKAGVHGKRSDLRIVTVAGQPVFNAMRLSRHPMTNLHLGAERDRPDALIRKVGPESWAALLDTCRQAAGAFPSCYTLGIDAAILANNRDHTVFEVNAFGDHVKGVCYRGATPQEWQILQLEDWLSNGYPDRRQATDWHARCAFYNA